METTTILAAESQKMPVILGWITSGGVAPTEYVGVGLTMEEARRDAEAFFIALNGGDAAMVDELLRSGAITVRYEERHISLPAVAPPPRTRTYYRGVAATGHVLKIVDDGRQNAPLSLMSIPLAMRLDLARHSPTGFGWGYLGSGPAQLALAILADACGDEIAIKHHQRFKDGVIARLDGAADFHLDQKDEVMDWVARLSTIMFADQSPS